LYLRRAKLGTAGSANAPRRRSTGDDRPRLSLAGSARLAQRAAAKRIDEFGDRPPIVTRKGAVIRTSTVAYAAFRSDPRRTIIGP
jgi:hypothetical protein